MPEDYTFIAGNKGSLRKQVLWAISNWSEATKEHDSAMDHFASQNDKSVVGKATLSDMQSLEQQRVDSYDPNWDAEVLESTMDYLQQDTATLQEINDASKQFTDAGEPVLDLYTYTLTDMVLCLKTLGYDEVPAEEPAFCTH
jgi:hypothetical protein